MSYFDSVLIDNMIPIFNGTTEETVKWLREHPEHSDKRVCFGKKTITLCLVPEYLEKFGK